VSVKRSWLVRGETIELSLPRNLTCAACKGGGCDRCERSGAITLRQRGVEAMPIQVPLPQRSADELATEPTLVLRIPEQGGVAPKGDLPRGLLLLQIVAADRPDTGVVKVRTGIARRLSGAPSRPKSSEAKEPASSARARSHSPEAPRSPGWQLVFLMIAVAWIAVILLLSARLPH
jgi:hypothetical protein